MVTARSCMTCPSYMVDDNAIRTRFGKTTASAMCALYGHVLSRPGQPNEEICEHVASSCDMYGKAMTSTPVSITPRVCEPDPEILVAGDTNRECATCYNCENIILQSEVIAKWGWPLAVCKAKGTLVLSPSKEARGCPWASPGSTHSIPVEMQLMPQFRPGFRIKDEVKLQVILGDTSVIDPATYRTDLKVEKNDKDQGIRAWRRFLDPTTGNEYYLPIFDRDYFTPEEQLHIPQTGKDFFNAGKPELYVDYNNILMDWIKDAYTLDYTLALEGEPGNGKTQFGICLAWHMQVPFTSLDISPEMNVEKFLGHPDIRDGKETFFQLGRLPKIWQRPGVGVSNEYQSGPDEIMYVYRGIFDLGVINIDYGEGMTLFKHDYFFHLTTGNPSWDMRNIGTRELADADAQRLCFKWVEEPPEPVLRFMLKRHCVEDGYEIPDETLDDIIKIRKDIRSLAEQGVYSGTWGTRQDMKVARLSAHYATLSEAYCRAALDHIDHDTRKIVLTAIESIVDDSKDEKSYEDPF